MGSPAHVRRVEVVVEGVGGAHLVHPADRPGVDQLLGLRDGRQEQLVVGAHEGDTGLLDGGGDLHGLLRCQAERLLAQDVLAGARGGDDRVLVQVMRQADVDGVDVCLRQHRGVVGVDRRSGVTRSALGALAHRIGDRGEGDGAGVREVALEVRSGDAAGPDQADANGGCDHGLLRRKGVSKGIRDSGCVRRSPERARPCTRCGRPRSRRRRSG